MELHIETAANYPMSSQPSDRSGEEQQKPRKSRLTMKVLLEQIEELQKENAQLAKRLHVLEGKMVYPLWREEAAAAAEIPASEGRGRDREQEIPLLLSQLMPDSGGVQEVPDAFAEDASAEAALPALSDLVQAVTSQQAAAPAWSTLPVPANDRSGGGKLLAGGLQPVLTPRSVRHPVRRRSFWLFFPFFRNRSV